MPAPEPASIPCPQCHAATGEPCRDYRGRRKVFCSARLNLFAQSQGSVGYHREKHRHIDGQVRTVELDPENPCAQCGAPTIRGLNTDFCSLACEISYSANHSFEQLALFAPTP